MEKKIVKHKLLLHKIILSINNILFNLLFYVVIRNVNRFNNLTSLQEIVLSSIFFSAFISFIVVRVYLHNLHDTILEEKMLEVQKKRKSYIKEIAIFASIPIAILLEYFIF